jgi:signal transduction histidine kinase
MSLEPELKLFAEQCRERRDAVTQIWLHAVQTSPDFTTPDRVPVPQLIDHLPGLLDDLVNCLHGEDEAEAADPNARAHGQHRWEQHFRLDELLRELLLLRRIVVQEIDRFQAEGRTPMSEALERKIRRRVEHFFEETIVRSTDEFYTQHEAEIEQDRRLLSSLHESAKEAAGQHQAVASARLRLLRVIAHELRNLLNAASLTSTSLPYEKDPAWRDELHQMLGRNLRQMTALVNQLLDVAPLLSGREPLTLAPMDILEFASQQRRGFEQMASAKGLSLAIQVAPGLDKVVTDEAKLQRIVTNLIQNAIKYTDAGGVEVEFSHPEGAGLEMRVADTGPGIPTDHHTKIFEEFHRVPGSKNQEGTGLGLAIVRELVSQLNGEIQVESRPGEGACFRIRLPKNEMAP